MCRLGPLPCRTPIRDKISATPPRCSPNTRLGNKPRGCVSREQQGDDVEILSHIEVRHENDQPTHPRAVHGKHRQFERVEVINMQRLAYL